jgi:hypothetical protein
MFDPRSDLRDFPRVKIQLDFTKPGHPLLPALPAHDDMIGIGEAG